MQKSPSVYIAILFVWIACVALLVGVCAKIAYDLLSEGELTAGKIVTAALIFVNVALLAYMWLGSVKDFMFSFIFLIRGRKIMRRYDPIINVNATLPSSNGQTNPRFLLLYCTCNDFNEDALAECMRQT